MPRSRHSIISEQKGLPCPEMFETLHTSLHSPRPPVLTKPLLQKLYLSLLHSSPQLSTSTLNHSHIRHISAYLFHELSKRFEEDAGSSKQQILGLLLRCCLAMLEFLEAEPALLVEKSRYILTILRKLCRSSDGLVILEVFVDELLLHRHLRLYFMWVDHVCFAHDKLFNHNFDLDYDDSVVVLEVISARFILSKSVDVSVSRGCKEALCPELSLTSAVQLLGTPVMVSAPRALQAYVLSLVSKSISVYRDLDEIWMECYISAFEISLILYVRHMFCSNGGSNSDRPSTSGRDNWPPFESYIRPVTYDGINQVADFGDHSPSFSFKTKSEFVITCEAYIEEITKILNKSFRSEIRSVLNSLVSQILISNVEGIVLHMSRDASLQEIYLLASIMNLMSNSLMQIIRYTVSGSLGHQKSINGRSFCGEYDFIIGIVGCFLQYCVNDSAQKLLKEVVGFTPIIIHFAGFLPFCYDSGHEYLWKSCLLVMMAIMILIFSEDGDLEALKTLLSSLEKSLSANSTIKSSKVLDSSRIASKIQKLRKLHSRNVSEEDTCSGENYLKARNMKQLDIDDLANFVEGKKEKDYTKYFKIRDNFRYLKNVERKIRKREKRKGTQRRFTGIKFHNL